MDDKSIIELYWQRSERAIEETELKYGPYCSTIAWNILENKQDAEECVNDTFLKAWLAMPPQRPNILHAFLGKITRHLSLNKYREKHSAKRGGGEIALVLDELADCLGTGDTTESEIERRELERTINAFLADLSAEERDIFLGRYWFAVPVSRLADSFGFSESKVKSLLYRMRARLRRYLEKEGMI